MINIRRIINKRKNLLISFLVIGIIFLGILLRRNNYYNVPRHGATFDEFAWTWLGINLINSGTPVSWSPHPLYKNREHLKYQGANFFIVKPYLEHPPLFGLVAGGFAKLRGVESMYEVTLPKIRPLGLLMGISSILAIFLLIKSLYGIRVSMLTTLLYSTIPTVVIGSRLVQNENFLIPLWLFGLIFLQKYITTKKRIYRNLSILIVSLLPLAKVPWIAAGFSVFLILTYHKKWKDAFYTVLCTIIFFSLFLTYGIVLDKELFFTLWGLQLSRYDIAFDGLFSLFTKPLLVDWYYLDGWIYFGWFAVFYLFQNLKKHIFIILPFMAYLLMYVFAIPDEPGHGWYRYPLYPFLIAATGIFIDQQLRKTTFAIILFFYLTGFSLLQNVWHTFFGFSYNIYRGFILFTALPVFTSLWFRGFEKCLRYFIYFMLGILILLNILAINTVNT